ncbi:MAG: phosphoglucosamine mutase [Gammaproteobacteria bacterium]|nr:phosphoglucosamine mutase [Gammaproteobacteria bacterium]
MSRSIFGTDGIRGRVGQFPITPDFCLRLGWAVGKVFGKEKDCHVLIGKDTRISGYMMESVLESGLSSAGVDVTLLSVMPTPAIAYLTRTLRADAGIVISASHNPYYDNGIKFFDGFGNKLNDATEKEIEFALDGDLTCVDSKDLGKVSRLEASNGRYIEFCKATVDRALSFNGLKLVVDCANGANYHVGPKIFEELGAEVISIGVDPNGTNINYQCGSTYPAMLSEEVIKQNADAGIAFDGDGDRVIMVNELGEIVDGDEILYIIACDRLRKNTLGGGIVGTMMTNQGLERALSSLGVPFVRADVGDRYVLELLREQGWSLGGETSGHIICHDISATGDGIVAALQVVASMVVEGKRLSQLTEGFIKSPQVLKNVACEGLTENILDSKYIAEALDSKTHDLAGKGRIVLRKSGTESVIRIMVEGEDMESITSVADDLAKTIQENAG